MAVLIPDCFFFFFSLSLSLAGRRRLDREWCRSDCMRGRSPTSLKLSAFSRFLCCTTLSHTPSSVAGMEQAMDAWSVAQVCDYFRGLGLADTARLTEEHIDGAALCDLSEAELKELGVPMGLRKAHLRRVGGSPPAVKQPVVKPPVPAVPGGAAQWPRFPGLSLERFVVSSGQAEVYKGTCSDALKLPIAAKVLYLDDGKSKRAFVAEVTALRLLKHVNILSLEAFFEDPQFCIVTWWMEQGALNEILERARRAGSLVPWQGRGRKYAAGIAAGLSYLHSHKVVHRDLKSLNVLVGADDVALLADFGLAKLVETASIQVATAHMGTPCWMAPEMIERGTYTAASDMYAFAIIVWELCACKFPYETMASRRQIEDFVVRGERPPLNAQWDREAKQLMAACWAKEPQRRLTAGQVAERLGKDVGVTASAPANAGNCSAWMEVV